MAVGQRRQSENGTQTEEEGVRGGSGVFLDPKYGLILSQQAFKQCNSFALCFSL